MHPRNLTWTPEIMVKGIASFEDGHFLLYPCEFYGLHNLLGLMKSAHTNFMDFLNYITSLQGFRDGLLSSV